MDEREKKHLFIGGKVGYFSSRLLVTCRSNSTIEKKEKRIKGSTVTYFVHLHIRHIYTKGHCLIIQ
jgi:hypothetical protein